MGALETAWAAGLFDGEGSIGMQHGWLHLQLKMVDEASVRRFAAAVSAGEVGGPYSNASAEKDGYRRSDFFMWYTRRGEPAKVLRMMWPHLTEVRRRRALELGFTP